MHEFIITQLLGDKDWHALLSGTLSQKSEAAPTISSTELLRTALLNGMSQEDAEIKAIAENDEKPTFDNTIVALARSGEALERATTLMYNLLSAETDDSLDELANEMSPLLSEHGNNIMLNAALFARVKTVYEQEKGKRVGEDEMLLRKTYEDFERSGATLNETDKLKFREITKKLSQTTLRFSQNLLKETNNYVLHITKEEELAGLPEMHKERAAAEAQSRGMTGWVFTLHAPSYVPFMMYASARQRREELYRAYNSRCTHDNEFNNFAVVNEIVNLRRELAQLLGYNDYADYALRRRMAECAENVYELLDDLITHYLPKAREDVAEVEAKAQALEGADFRLMPWDFAYYSQKLKQELYDFDPDALRPYFELNRVKEGIFGLATRLYGITFEEDRQIPVYHGDVSAYRVYDSRGAYLAMLFLDFFPRTSKKGGAWMTSYRDEHCDESTDTAVTPANSSRPVVSVTTNFTPPSADKPALLTLDEVETFLHEFGHALHGIFAMTHYAALSGTSVYWDFVELPSQFMENYATEPDFLGTFARHYQTGEPLPYEYVERIRTSRHFQAGYSSIRQVSFCLLDMAYYTQAAAITQSVKSFEDAAWARVKLLPTIPEACMSVQFSHIMSGGYAAGYYSYRWAEVLDADAFELFKEKGLFNRQVADSFRENVLSKGGTEPPMSLYKRFRGKRPDITALLRRDGMLE